LYLIFPGEGLYDIPESVTSDSNVWSNWSLNGWVDEEHFQAYILLYINEINKICKRKGVLNETHNLLLDGHTSCYNINTLWTAALNHIIIFFGPSQLTNCWQANDAGTNKKWKDNLQKELSPIIKSKVSILTSSLAQMVIAAIETPDMPTVIKKLLPSCWNMAT
jgi:hypothetical protein